MAFFLQEHTKKEKIRDRSWTQEITVVGHADQKVRTAGEKDRWRQRE